MCRHGLLAPHPNSTRLCCCFCTFHTPSWQPRTPLLCSPSSLKKTSNDSDKKNLPPKTLALSSMLEHIAMTLAGAGTLKLGKRCTSSTQADPWPTKKNCGAHVVGKLDDDHKGSGSATEDDSEAEHKEVQECLLQLATLSPAAQQQHRAIFTAFSTVPRVLPQSRSCSRSPSAHPCRQLPHTTPATANANTKVSLRLFMGGIKVPMKPPQ